MGQGPWQTDESAAREHRIHQSRQRGFTSSADDFPFSYCNINPQELILTFNYGDTIHFSGEQKKLSTLLETEQNAAYYKHAVLLAITNLSHLYFGFAVLVEAALGQTN
jgi:hypothetical protein